MAKFPQQLKPLMLIVIVLMAGLFFARRLLIPESFGQYGHYRANAVNEIANLPIAYAGVQVCAECHDDIAQKRLESHHRDVACETCHGPAAQHANSPDEFTPSAPRDRSFCPLCHGYNPSRPSGFPQVIAERHNPGKPCMACHDPHNPLTPETVKECDACHRAIVNQKSVSAHAELLCSQCHEVPPEHLVKPRMVAARKPSNRSTCGTCHDKSSSVMPGVPAVDIESHGGRYQCWDCHYPHSPEASI